jgi:hypothetical protein
MKASGRFRNSKPPVAAAFSPQPAPVPLLLLER